MDHNTKPTVRDALTARLPNRRTALKWLHWSVVPLMIWFTFMTPEIVLRLGGQTFFQVHSVLGLVFVTLALLWTADYLRRGLAGRPGPKLPPWGRLLHRALHVTLIWGLFGVALTGFLLGLTSATVLNAGGVLPIAPALNLPKANEIAGLVNTIEFYLLAAIALVHAGFHIWRHFRLQDNALRIMVPRALHRYL